MDGIDLPAWSSRDSYDTRQGFGHPEARIGRGKKGFYLGYQILFLVDIEGFPLGYVEAPANVNEKKLVEELRARVLDESLEVELLAADTQLESRQVLDLLESLKIGNIIACSRMNGRVNPPGVLMVRDRIDVGVPNGMRVMYKRLRVVVEVVNGRAKSRLA